MRRINPILNELESLQRVYADVRGLVWQNYGGRLDELARLANLNAKTVEALMWGDTKKPQFETIFKLMIVLGLERKLLALFASESPITADMGRQLKGS